MVYYYVIYTLPSRVASKLHLKINKLVSPVHHVCTTMHSSSARVLPPHYRTMDDLSSNPRDTFEHISESTCQYLSRKLSAGRLHVLYYGTWNSISLREGYIYSVVVLCTALQYDHDLDWLRVWKHSTGAQNNQFLPERLAKTESEYTNSLAEPDLHNTHLHVTAQFLPTLTLSRNRD